MGECNTVVTAPLHYTRDQRNVIRDCATKAGFRVPSVQGDQWAWCGVSGIWSGSGWYEWEIPCTGAQVRWCQQHTHCGPGVRWLLASQDVDIGGDQATEVLVQYLGANRNIKRIFWRTREEKLNWPQEPRLSNMFSVHWTLLTLRRVCLMVWTLAPMWPGPGLITRCPTSPQTCWHHCPHCWPVQDLPQLTLARWSWRVEHPRLSSCRLCWPASFPMLR